MKPVIFTGAAVALVTPFNPDGSVNYDEFGKLISRTYNRGNCKLNVLVQLLQPLGYELVIVKQEEINE